MSKNDQLVYYTTEPLNAGTEGTHYKYRLMVIKPDGDTLTALTGLVGNEEFEIITNGFSFEEQETNAMNRIMFRADGVASMASRHGALWNNKCPKMQYCPKKMLFLQFLIK